MFKNYGTGVGARNKHLESLLEKSSPSIQWVEVITENYLPEPGLPPLLSRQRLRQLREAYPTALHGTSLNLGSTDPLGENYLQRLEALVRETDPMWVSDHLCWTGVGGVSTQDLLPIPYTVEAVDWVVDRIRRVQDRLKRRILIENLSTYVDFKHSEMKEWEFLSEVANRSDCGLLLDLNNVYVNSVNHQFDPLDYLTRIPVERIGQIHLAGHTVKDGYLIDTHDAPVCSQVWDLLKWSVARWGARSTMIEWDGNIPEFERLEQEVDTAARIIRETQILPKSENLMETHALTL